MINRIGVISDTHGFFDERIAELFAGVSLILHAGDVGSDHILERLSHLAPVCAVRGNVDADGSCATLPESVQIIVSGYTIFMTHIFNLPEDGPSPDLPDPAPDVAIFGHSHKQCHLNREDTLYLNPASAGRQRFTNPRSLIILSVDSDSLEAWLVAL